MAKKDKNKPAKPTKSKQDAGGGKAGVSKNKSDKVVAGSEAGDKQPPNQQGGAGDPTANQRGSLSSQKDGQVPGSETGTRSSKIVTTPEWDSETVCKTNLIQDGFSCCIVLVMEDSPDLSKFGEFLLRAVETGVRRKFQCISGAQTAERVKRFLASHNQPVEDQSYLERQELFAQAIKYTLLGIKDTVADEIDADHLTKEMELAGARSKDLIKYVPPLKIPVQGSPGGSPGGEATGDGIREPPPAPPPTEQGLVQHDLPKKSSKSKAEDGPSNGLGKPHGTASLQEGKVGVKTRMRKRGEVPMPEFEVIDDSPPKGPRSYILLQGFYDPRLIDELRKIGVKVDGILLMTDAKVNRYNFSIIDVEDSIPGTFKPKNVLPQYLKAMEKLSQNPETRNSEVTQFWSKLSEMYNSATIDSPFHDIALMNFPLPDSKRINLESTDGITYYVSKMYDEVAKRVYEMLVLEEWFHEFSSAADITKLQPLEPALPREMYDQIIGGIPSECISVPIILEALVQQVAQTLEIESGSTVPEPCYEKDATEGIITGKTSFGSTNWGLATTKTQEEADGSMTEEGANDNSNTFALFKVPMYIKAGDYASIRSCHLNESLASKIASCQLSGDIRNIRGFLYQKAPEFNRGLYMKLLGNLNHFMYFMPPDMIQFEDMFYILHLLMSAGVEVQLQKVAAEKASKKRETSRPSSFVYQDGVYFQNRPGDPKFPGTNLSTDKNYLAVNNKSGLHFVISPNSNHELTVASIGHSQNQPDSAAEKAKSRSIFQSVLKDAQQLQPEQQKNQEHTSDLEEVSDSHSQQHKKLKKKKSKSKRQLEQQLDVNKAARVTTVGAIQSAATYAQSVNEVTDKQESEILEKRKNNKKDKSNKGKKGKVREEESDGAAKGSQQEVEASKTPSGAWSERANARGDNNQGTSGDVMDNQTLGILGEIAEEKENKTGFASMNYPSKETKRFIACEEQWFEDINETSVIQALLECPALLAINESGALDLSKWIEKYLLSTGMDVGPEDGVLLGDLKNWNYVEELVPIQTVQMLNEASLEYLSMQRMYCPFYDTILFIFNNPMPKELTAETQFYFRLKTLPGLQHFLEYAMDDKNILRWIEQLDAGKRLEVGEQTSINTLLSIIPEEQWLMVPSIKYQIMVDNQRSLSDAVSGGSVAANKGTFYGKIGNYNHLIPEETPTSGSTKSFQPGSRGSQTPGVTADDTATEDTVAIDIPVEKEDSPKATTPASVKGSVKAKSEKGERKLSDSGTKSDKKTARKSADVSRNESGETPPTAQQNSPESALGENDKSFHFDEKESLNKTREKELLKSSLNFTCYDLGKRVAVVGNDTFFLFPMDGTTIRYDISTIEPEFRMMQLTVTKNRHQTFFYPYYIPHDFDLSSEDYVVCPYFHMVLANGTIFAFKDLRAEEAAPYLKIEMTKQAQNPLFSFEKVLFGTEVEKKLNEVAVAGSEKGDRGDSAGSGTSDKHSEGKPKRSHDSTRSGTGKYADSQGGGDKADAGHEKEDQLSQTKKNKKGVKDKKSKKLHDKSPDAKDEKDKDKKKGKKDKGKKGKKHGEPEQEHEDDADQVTQNAALPSTPPGQVDGADESGEEETQVSSAEEPVPAPPPTSEADDIPNAGGVSKDGEWMYPSSENSDDETETQKRRLYFAPPWDDAVQLIQPMVHNFTVTLPSGLVASVEDLPGPPLVRVVKQHYLGQGSARSSIEGSRYYTMDGSVIKFLMNGTIQILTARGVTTTIDELAANAKRDTDNILSAFGSASIVKIFNGEVILPNGQLWQVQNGKKVSKTPIYVFTTGPLAGGEVFRRRQDGVVYLHRYDGTVITHYPDGTRFTTRMVILETNKSHPAGPSESTPAVPQNSASYMAFPPAQMLFEQEPEEEETDEEFSDWVFVGLKYMIEHPNYSTVLFNTLSGNVHLKLPNGEWVRVFADGNVRVSTEDQYCLDVDKNRALLSYPPCAQGRASLPNLTAVRLWHTAVKASSDIPPPEVPPSPDDLPTEASTRRESQAPLVEKKEEQDVDPAQKKKSRNLHHGKSLHPKVKQREVAKTKGRATRVGSLVGQANVEGTKTVASLQANPGAASKQDLDDTQQTGMNDQMDSAQPSASQFPVYPSESQINAESPKPSLRQFGDSLADFLMFKDETTFCRSVDSWDNRFQMNVYGGAVVDKMEKASVGNEMNAHQLIETLSEHSHLPKNYISGILKNTSSENLETAARRLQSIRKGYSESCTGSLPNTKIFVVKRDLSAFQYLQKAQVDDVVTKAYGSRESMVIVDPVPKRQPRKFVTIMRPVEEVDEPHGMWTRPYIEPIFRPRGVTNKHLRIATPNDLRWFGYILNSAHGRRPKFIPEPKEVFKDKRSLQMKQEMGTSSDSPQEVEQTRRQTLQKSIDMGSMKSPSGIIAPPGDDVGGSGRTSEEEEGYSGEGEEEATSGEETNIPRTSLVEDDKKKKSKKDKKGKEKEPEPVKKIKGKDKEKKAKGKASLVNVEPEEELEMEAEDPKTENLSVGEGSILEDDALRSKGSSRSPRQSLNSRLQALEPEIDDYPAELEDIQGIYAIEKERRSSNLPRILAKDHNLQCNTKKAVVVRAFVEIPQVDENMQRALLAASMSYAETCKTETAIFKTYKPEDPRSADERQKQTGYKQQLIEQNIDEMHLLEQKPGPVLRFHF